MLFIEHIFYDESIFSRTVDSIVDVIATLMFGIDQQKIYFRKHLSGFSKIYKMFGVYFM